MRTSNMYNRWLELFSHDEDMRTELISIAENPGEIEERFYRDLEFGTAGLRGVLGAGTNRMNRYVIMRATQGLAAYVRESGHPGRAVAIGYDSRRCSQEFALIAARILAQNGIKAYLFDALRPVPLLSFAVRHLGAIAGIVVTASHNPKEYNGYKVYWEDGGQIASARAGRITEIINSLDYANYPMIDEDEAVRAGLIEYIGENVDAPYFDMLLSGLKALGGGVDGHEMVAVYSPLNGSGNVPVRKVLAMAGFDVRVVAEQELPDPDFTTVGVPNPENPKAFTLAIELAKKINADYAFATDPDADRLGVAVRDGDGSYKLLSGNQIGCLLADFIMRKRLEAGTLGKNCAIVRSIVSTDMADLIAHSYGVKCYSALTGFKFIAEKIEEMKLAGEEFLFGFEESYGYLSTTSVRDKDAVDASLLLAHCAAYYKSRGLTLLDGLEKLYSKHGYYAERVPTYVYEGKDGAEKMALIMEKLRKNPPESIGGTPVSAVRDYLAGLRNGEPMGMPPSNVLYYELGETGWVCIRPSGTEPKIKVYVSARGTSPTEADSTANALLEDFSVRLG